MTNDMNVTSFLMKSNSMSPMKYTLVCIAFIVASSTQITMAAIQVGGTCDVGDHANNQGLYQPHPTNCGKYLQCVHGTFMAMPCPPSLQWNHKVKACDWQRNVRCQDNFRIAGSYVDPNPNRQCCRGQ